MHEIIDSLGECGVKVRQGTVSRTVFKPYWEAKARGLPMIVEDRPMHIDTRPNAFVADHLYLNHISNGSVNAHFFEVADEWVETLTGRERPLLPPGLQHLFNFARTDDSILKPVDHLAVAGVGSTIIHRHSGHNPLAHYFESTSFPRTSTLRIAMVGAPARYIEPKLAEQSA